MLDAGSIEELSTAELRRLVGELHAEVMRLREEATRLQDENAALKGEVARLKGLPGRPTLKPSGMEPAAGRERGAQPQRRGGSKRDTLPVSEEQVLTVAAPAGSRFKGYEDYLVQDLRLRPRVIRYRRERWQTPEGQNLSWRPCRRGSSAASARSCAASCCCSTIRARSPPSGSPRS